MSVLVTGGAGFIGARVITKLLASGEKPVCFDINPGMAGFADTAGEVKLVRGDVTCVEEILAAIQRYRASKIVHLAVQREGLHAAMRISALGTNCVFEAARLAGIKRVVFTSSVAYHGPQASFGERPVTEEDQGFPTIHYGAIKWMNEFMARAYNTHYGMEVTALRIALAYGWQTRGGLAWANNLITHPATGRRADIPCRSTQKVCLIHVDDVAEILSRLVLKEKLGYPVYHSGGETCTVEEMARIVRGLVPHAEIRFDEQAEDIPFAYLVDNSRLRRELGFEIRSLADGIRQVIAAVRNEGTSH